MTNAYYMQTGEHGTEKGVVVREIEKYEDGTIKVINELGNGAGWEFTVDDNGLVPLAKEDYDDFISSDLRQGYPDFNAKA